MPFSRPPGAHLMGNSQLYQLYQVYDRFSLGVPNGIMNSIHLKFILVWETNTIDTIDTIDTVVEYGTLQRSTALESHEFGTFHCITHFDTVMIQLIQFTLDWNLVRRQSDSW